MITNCPVSITEDELTFIENTDGSYTAWVTDFPAVLQEGETKKEVLNKINTTLKGLHLNSK